MKITFGHLDLCYPDPEKMSLEFEAETEFELAYLKSLKNLEHEFGPFEFIHPGNSKHGKLCLRGKKKGK